MKKFKTYLGAVLIASVFFACKEKRDSLSGAIEACQLEDVLKVVLLRAPEWSRMIEEEEEHIIMNVADFNMNFDSIPETSLEFLYYFSPDSLKAIDIFSTSYL